MQAGEVSFAVAVVVAEEEVEEAGWVELIE